MAKVHFTSQLERFLKAPSVVAPGQTVADVFAAVFDENPALKGYVLDDQGAIRRHVAVFIDGTQIKDRTGLTDPVGTTSEIHVFQALSGG